MRVSYFIKCISAFILCCLQAVASLGQTISAPSLIYPGNGDTIAILFPSFSFSLAYPIEATSQAKYEIRIVEMLSHQTPQAAILANPDYYSQTNLNTNLFSYPISAPHFKKNKSYAWQIHLIYNQNTSQGEVASAQQRRIGSEVFFFTVYDDMSNEACIPFLFEKLDQRFYVFNQELRFQFKNEVDVEKMQYKILNMKEQPITEQPIIAIKSKDNAYYYIPLNKYETFRKKNNKGKFYILNASGIDGRIYKLKFTFN